MHIARLSTFGINISIVGAREKLLTQQFKIFNNYLNYLR